jgi:hypothetical protein
MVTTGTELLQVENKPVLVILVTLIVCAKPFIDINKNRIEKIFFIINFIETLFF